MEHHGATLNDHGQYFRICCRIEPVYAGMRERNSVAGVQMMLELVGNGDIQAAVEYEIEKSSVTFGRNGGAGVIFSGAEFENAGGVV